MQAIGYIRVSTADQSDNGVSLKDQAEKIKDYCKFKEFDLVDIIEDKGISAGIPLSERPGGQELEQMVADDDIDIIVSVKLDRLFRDAVDCLNTSKSWDEQGKALHLLDLGGGTLDTSTAMGRMFLTMSAGFAEMERNLVKERTKTALAYKKKNKEVYSGIPFGYDRKNDRLVRNENEQKAIRLMQRLRNQGETLRSIAAELENRNIKTKKGNSKWYAQTVSQILKNDLHKEAI